MATTNYIWDETNDTVLQEKDETGATTARYTNKPELYGKTLSQERGTEKRYFHYDGRGSTRALTDENQNVTDTLSYTAFGEEVERTGSTFTPYHFQGAHGYQSDNETGMIYIRRRAYELAIGRWTSLDPLWDTMDLNRYKYVENMPTRMSDPPGLVGREPASLQPCAASCEGATLEHDARAGCDWFFDKDDGRLKLGLNIFTVQVEMFSADGNCQCCEYRHFVKHSVAQRVSVDERTRLFQVITYPQSGFVRNPNDYWQEDCVIDANGEVQCYGRRSGENRGTFDVYEDPDRTTGCKYTAKDQPGITFESRRFRRDTTIEMQAKWSFLFMVKDVCSDHPKNAKTVTAKEFNAECNLSITFEVRTNKVTVNEWGGFDN